MILKRIVYLQCVIVLISLLAPLFVFGQAGDSFTLSQRIGSDTIPPSTPPSITPIPITATQIDISWATSTDDQELTGYRLFRDALQIATTSLSSYSDIGLTPSTTYSYTVEAYDWFFNISTTSAPGVTTTPAVPVILPVVTPTSTSNVGSQMSPRLISLEIDPSQTSAQFDWSTNIYTRYVLRWGSSSEYDLGFIQNEVFSRTHTTNVQGLEQGTRYLYELIGVNQLGHESLLKRGSFTTTQDLDTTAPANVSGVKAIVDTDSVYIQWVNPTDADFEKIRVVRNYLFYPRDPVDGFIVYEGSAQSFFDAEALSSYPDQYYTIFAYDTTGNISSGAITFARQSGWSVTINTDDNTTIEDVDDLPIGFSDVLFIQKNEIVPQKDSQVAINSEEPLGIQIPASLLSGNLKTIVVTITGTYSEAQSYILRSNSEKTVYQALLRNLPEGQYEAFFTVYEYQTQVQKTFSGQILSQKSVSSNDPQLDEQQNISEVGSSLVAEYGLVIVALLLLLLILRFLLFTRRASEDN